MGVRYEIKARIGEKDGKAMYAKIGVVLEGDKGFSMKLNYLPMNWDGFAFFSEPEQRGGGGGHNRGGNGGGGRGQGGGRQSDPEDDIPF